MPVTAESKLKLSPSLHHQRLLKSITPSLAYDGGDVKKWQRRLRPKLRQLMGVPENDHGPLRVKSLWKREHALGTIEKVAFAGEPDSDIVGYYCLPKDGQAPLPAIICLQGHTTGMHHSIAVERDDESKPMEIAGDRDFALHAMKHGWAAL